MVCVTFILNGSPQKIIQRTSKRPIDITFSADYLIFKNSEQKIEGYGYVVCVTCGTVLLKPNVLHVILNFWNQKYVEMAR